MVSRRELSLLYREDARFDEAIDMGIDGLQIARELNDTLEIIRALNSIGTSFRRIGALDEAYTYDVPAGTNMNTSVTFTLLRF